MVICYIHTKEFEIIPHDIRMEEVLKTIHNTISTYYAIDYDRTLLVAFISYSKLIIEPPKTFCLRRRW